PRPPDRRRAPNQRGGASVQSLKERILNPEPSDAFGTSYLQLCQVSYAVPADIPGLVQKVSPLFQSGHWHCAWGPSADPDDANLVYVATYTETGSTQPLMAAVVIRGTDVDVQDVWGVLRQAFEDLMVPVQSPLPWLNNPQVLIADGTLDALA